VILGAGPLVLGELVVALRRPPDEPDAEEDRDLQDHGEEDDRPDALHPAESLEAMPRAGKG
jgi:hypothetical protein